MIKYSKAIAGNTDFLTAQAFTFFREGFTSSGSGQILLSIVISGSGEDVFTKVRQAGMDSEDVFFDGDGPVAQRLSLVLDFFKSQLSTVENLQIVIVVWQETVLYLLAQGLAQVYLLRQGKLENLIAASPEGQLISGFLQPEDRLLILSSRLPDEVEDRPQNWDEELVNKLVRVSTENLEEEVNINLSIGKTLEPVAAILIESEVEIKKDEGLSEQPTISSVGFESDVTPKRHLDTAKILIPTTQLIKTIWENKKLRLLTIGLIILILILGGGWTIYQQSSQQKNGQLNALLSQAKTDFEKAKSEKDSDPQAAQKDLSQAKMQLDQALKLNPKNSQAQDLQKQIENESGEILKLSQISDWPLFLSLDLIKKDFNATRMSYSLGKVLLLDEAQKTLVSLDLAKKTNQILAGSTQLGQAKFAALNGEKAFVYSDDKGVLEVDLGSQKTTQVVKPDSDWGKIADVYGFSSNIYLVDELKNQILKYVAVKNGYADKQSYLKPEVKPDLAGTKQLRIDYSLWVLKSGPEILKFTAGAPDSFNVGGLDKSIGTDVPSIFVPEDGDNLYVLDRSNSRLVTLKKNGQYVSQIAGEKFKTATDLVVDDNKLYLLDSGKIYSLDLK